MRRRVYLIAVAVVFFLSSFGYYVFSHSFYPEKAIVGEWREVSWVYDRNNDNAKVKQEITEEERENIANHLVIHQFENWTFDENHGLKLHERSGREHTVKWILKDRGRILQLINEDGTQEVYSVESLKKDELVLHFDTDVHARGIVKITMQRQTQ